MNTQTNSIIFNFQVRSYGILVNDVNVAHGEKQMISTPNGTMIPIIYKGGLPYLEHYFPTDKENGILVYLMIHQILQRRGSDSYHQRLLMILMISTI